jgi:hypothetical protein
MGIDFRCVARVRVAHSTLSTNLVVIIFTDRKFASGERG